MSECFNGLSTINIELSSRCDKACWMCGRRKVDSGKYPGLKIEIFHLDLLGLLSFQFGFYITKHFFRMQHI